MVNDYELFKTLGDKTRLKIVKILLNKDELCVSDIQGIVGTSQPNISQHLRELKKVGLVVMKRKGKECCYLVKDKSSVKKLLDTVEHL